jgi:hypothetical protein
MRQRAIAFSSLVDAFIIFAELSPKFCNEEVSGQRSDVTLTLVAPLDAAKTEEAGTNNAVKIAPNKM